LFRFCSIRNSKTARRPQSPNQAGRAAPQERDSMKTEELDSLQMNIDALARRLADAQTGAEGASDRLITEALLLAIARQNQGIIKQLNYLTTLAAARS
jgi:hypothetical protein